MQENGVTDQRKKKERQKLKEESESIVNGGQ